MKNQGHHRQSSFFSRAFGDVTGAFGDLGTFLPLVVAILATGQFDAAPLLLGFGVFAVATGLFYRRPVPVQPMKAVSAVLILGESGPQEAAATGMIIGAALIILAATGLASRLQRIVPLSVLLGIQLGLGASLFAGAYGIASTPAAAMSASVIAVALIAATWLKKGPAIAGVAALVGLCWVGLTTPLPPISLQFPLPEFHLPSIATFNAAVTGIALPQFALTLTNAVLLTAFLAADYFPDARERVTPRRLAFFTGISNLVLAPFGALPMCHGAGGLPAQYRLGARTGLTPIVFGLCCLGLAFLSGEQAALWLAVVPVAAIAGLLAFAGYQLVNLPKLMTIRPDCYPVVALTALCCLFIDAAAGLLVGVLAEFGRSTWSARKIRH